MSSPHTTQTWLLIPQRKPASDAVKKLLKIFGSSLLLNLLGLMPPEVSRLGPWSPANCIWMMGLLVICSVFYGSLQQCDTVYFGSD